MADEETGFEPEPEPEEVEVTCSGGITLPPLKTWSEQDAPDDDSA